MSVGKSLSYYLNKYYDIQEDICLVYRQYQNSPWSDRCIFLKEGYASHKPYNHRSILNKEVVIEYDTKTPSLNLKLADMTITNLNKDNISFSKWTSGNKSVHIHFFINTKECHNIPLLKNTVMRYYGTHKIEDTVYIPDLRLAANGHLIRAEGGVHEKTQNKKSPLYVCKDYPRLNELNDEIWAKYIKTQKEVTQRRLSIDLGSLKDSKGLKFILTTYEFKTADDGRERALFMLIHLLKSKWLENKEGFVQYLWDWYKYSGGYSLTEQDIRNKVNYHWNRTYFIGKRYLNELLESIGRSDLIDKDI